MKSIIFIIIFASWLVADYHFDDTNLLYIEHDIAYFEDSDGFTVGVGKELIIKLNQSQDIDFIIQNYDINVLKRLTPSIFLLETSNYLATIEIVQSLQQYEFIEYAHINLIKQVLNR